MLERLRRLLPPPAEALEPGRPDGWPAVEAALGTGLPSDFKAFTELYGSGTFWTFEDPAVMQLKGEYVKANRLGGIMFWELSGDTPGGDLITAIASSLDP